MNLNKDEVQELNKEVTKGGSNYIWLQKNITKKNPQVSERLKELLQIK